MEFLVFILASKILWARKELFYAKHSQLPGEKIHEKPYFLQLSKLDSKSVREADSNIVEYVFPHAEHLVTLLIVEVFELRGDAMEFYRKATEDAYFEAELHKLFRRLVEIQASIHRCHHQLSQFLGMYTTSTKMDRLLKDYKMILTQSHDLQSEISFFCQVSDSHKSYQSSILAIKMSSVACIVVPVGLVISMFSTSVTGLTDAKLKTFVITVMVALVVGLFGTAIIIGRAFVAIGVKWLIERTPRYLCKWRRLRRWAEKGNPEGSV